MPTKFYWHETARMVAVMNNRDIDAYLLDHPALPGPGPEWISILPIESRLPLEDARKHLLDNGAEDIPVFRAWQQPTRIMKWSSTLVHLIATLKNANARNQLLNATLT